MSIINSVLKVFVGDKKKKDLKLLQPVVKNVHSFENEISALTNDELRAKTIYFKNKIKEGTNEFTTKIKDLEAEAHDANVDRKEEIYTEIDSLEDLSYEASEVILTEIMPEAFAVIKETAKRFTQNDSITVTATPFDRELSATKSNIVLDNEKASWIKENMLLSAKGLMKTFHDEKSTYCHKYPKKALHSFRFKLTRQWVRVDCVQHAACFFARLLKVLK